MNLLLVYPQYPDTYWSFKHALRFIWKKAAVPSLELITVSALLLASWMKNLIDLKIERLSDLVIKWVNFIFLSGIYIQKKSINTILKQCEVGNAKVVAGDPLFTLEFRNFPQIDHFVLNEAEITLPLFLNDLLSGGKLKKVYHTTEYAYLQYSPVPDYHLLKMKDYAYMNIQIPSGCPFACDFCEITYLLAYRVRLKQCSQIINELYLLYKLNLSGAIAVVDYNFIGNKHYIKNNLLPKVKQWMAEHKYPFQFTVQTSINLVDNELQLELMRTTRFSSAFIGIETPDEKSLQHCNKVQNENCDLVCDVKKIQRSGLLVSSGFVSAIDGLLNETMNTRLYKKTKRSNRLTTKLTGSNTDFMMIFLPQICISDLMEGYKHIIKSIYAYKPYYKRIRELLCIYNPVSFGKSKLDSSKILAFIKSIFIIGIKDNGRLDYWNFLLRTLLHKPAFFADAITIAVYGYHYRTAYGLRKAKS